MAKSTTPRTTTARAPAKPRATKPKAAPKTAAKSAPRTVRPAAKSGAAAPGVIRRNAVPLAGALVAGAAAAAALFFTRTSGDLPAGHAAPDLEGDEHPGAEDRADPHFRPDIDAPMTAEDRAALAPALGKPTMVGNG